MFRTALRNVLAHKARLLMTVLAVFLGVVFVSGTLVFTDSFSTAYRHSSERGFDRVDLALRPGRAPEGGRPDAQPPLTGKLLHAVSALPQARTATGVVTGYAAVADRHGDAVGEGWSTRGGNYAPGRGGADPRYPLTSGRAPHGADEVLLDAGTARRAGYHVGDTVRVSVDGPVLRRTLVGVFTTDDGEVAAGGTLALFDTPTAQRLFTAPGRYSEIDAEAAPGTSQAALQHAVARVLPPGVDSTTGQALADEQALRVAGSLASLRSTLLVFAGIALFVGVFLIANTFTMLTAQRTRELALLRAVGATRRQVSRSVLTEAFLVAVVASLAGLLGGIGVGASLRGLIGSISSGPQVLPAGPLVVSPTTVLVSLAVGVAVTMAAAWLPARRAGKVPPVAAMAAVHAPATGRSLVLRNTLGALLSAAGVAVVVGGTGMNRDDGQLVIALGAAVLMVGVLVLTPLLSRPFVALTAPLLRAAGAPGRLARGNAVRNPRRTAATASALTIGLALITGLTVIALSSQHAADARSTATLRADYVVRMGSGDDLSGRVEHALAGVDGVTAVSPLRSAPGRAAGEDTFLTGADGADLGRLVHPEVTRGSLAGFGGDRIAVDTDTAAAHGWTAGSTVPLTFPDGKRGRAAVAAVYRSTDLLYGIVVDTRVLDPHLAEPTAREVLVKTAHGAAPGTARALRRALGDSPAVQVSSRQDISAAASRSVTVGLNLVYGLLGMAIVVAILGVVNTLVMSVSERSSEIGMLRAIGLDRPGVKRMVRLESLVISLFGGVLGTALGVFFGWAGGRLLFADQPDYTLVLPWGRLLVVLAAACAVGLLAALWPARNAARLNILAAIHTA